MLVVTPKGRRLQTSAEPEFRRIGDHPIWQATICGSNLVVGYGQDKIEALASLRQDIGHRWDDWVLGKANGTSDAGQKHVADVRRWLRSVFVEVA